MHFVYIIKSLKDNSYYIGETSNLEERLVFHNSTKLNNGYTKHGIPWEYFLSINCKDRPHALKVERHIKKMKSSIYIENLKKYPEMQAKLLAKYLK